MNKPCWFPVLMEVINVIKVMFFGETLSFDEWKMNIESELFLVLALDRICIDYHEEFVIRAQYQGRN